MSAKKRRRKAKLARLAKLDQNYSRLCLLKSPRRDGPRSWRFWFNCVVALGDALERKKPGAWRSLDRCETGPFILGHNYKKRNGLL